MPFFIDKRTFTEALCEDLLFCKYIHNTTMADELFKTMDSFFKQHGLTWENCVGRCSDGAQTMAGIRKGLQALVKRVAPDTHWTHCVWFQLCWGGLVYRDDLWHHAEVYSSDSQCILDWNGEGVSAHRAESCVHSSSLQDGLFSRFSLTENKV